VREVYQSSFPESSTTFMVPSHLLALEGRLFLIGLLQHSEWLILTRVCGIFAEQGRPSSACSGLGSRRPGRTGPC
jgi:hypothetical protein